MNQRPATPEDLRICLQITEKLIKHPISSIFLRPVDPITDAAPDYLSKIRNPQDLGTIKRRLEEKTYYKYISDWQRDMNLIWKNCIRYNGENTYFFSVAREFKCLFEKLSRPITTKNYEEWILRVNELFERIDSLLQRSPPPIKENFDGKAFKSALTNQALEKYVNYSQQLTSPDDILHFIQISLLSGATYKQDDNNFVGEINLKTMNKHGKRQLIMYTKERTLATRAALQT